MSLLTAVENAIKSCKEEQARLDCRIQYYREVVLHSHTTPHESELTDAAATTATDTATCPGEEEDLKLIEQTLEKALQLRTRYSLFNEDSEGTKASQTRKKLPDTGVQSKGSTSKASAASKGKQSTTALKCGNLDRRGQRKPGTSSSRGARSSAVCYPASKNGIHNRPAPSAVKHAPRVTTSVGKVARSSLQSEDDSAKASTVSCSSTKVEDTEDHHQAPPQPRRTQCEQTAQWKSLWMNQNRLWDKVTAAQRKPAPGRSRFMERMSATFPKGWPHGSPDQIRGLVGRLNYQTDELVQQCQTKDLLDQSTETGVKEDKHSCLLLERLQRTAADLQRTAEQAKQELEAWDRCRPEGGCLCAVRTVEDEATAGRLPVTINYNSEAELRELETLRMRVALLQQEISFQQALQDALAPQLASIIPSCPNRSVLRDLYSLLGEGGQRFPAIVQDYQPE
ncbi:uncharacterized protein tedc2 [Nerophis lumbriciformis]|uniref:uncharacterized protein tedc2 n=1 Tax=Nerophis lumbriciformis TaxID=546530 RepID=UPI002AE02DAA|nr:uncharacterized protein LOC133615133 [Nerophis lumbriciformis]